MRIKWLVCFCVFFLSLNLTSCQKDNKTISFQTVGSGRIPMDSFLRDPIVIGNKIFFLDIISDNIFITTMIEKKLLPLEFKLSFDGTLFSNRILKAPVSMCMDDKQNIYIAQNSDKIDYDIPYFSLSLSYTEIVPFYLMKVDQKNEIVEYNMLEKIPELIERKLVVKQIVFWNDYLVINFLRSPTALFVDTKKLNDSTQKYFFIEQPDEIIDLEFFSNVLWFLLKNEVIAYQIGNNLDLKQTEKIQIKTVSEITNLCFNEKNDKIILFDFNDLDRKKSTIYKIDLFTQNIDIIPAESIYFVFTLYNDNKSEVFAFIETSTKIQNEFHDYQDICIFP